MLRFCCKTIFAIKMSNIDSKDGHKRATSIQKAVQLDSIIAFSQRSEEFCNTLASKAGQ